MPEQITPTLPPQGQSINQLANETVLVEGKLGGSRLGGDLFINTESDAIKEQTGDFKVGQLPSDLLMTIDIGTNDEEAAYNKLGIVRTKLGSNNTDVDDILLVRLEVGYDGQYKVPDNKQGGLSSFKLIPNKEVQIGRNPKNNSAEVEQLGLIPDLKMSNLHLAIHLDEHGGIRVTDTNSTNGTDIKYMGEPEVFTHEDLRNDMEALRMEIAAKSGKIVLDSETGASSSGRKLIDSDSVPKSAEEALEAQEDARLERMKPLFEEKKRLEEQIEEIRGKYDADQQRLMTRYANQWILKREAQDANDGDGSYHYEAEASKALFALPKSAHNDAEKVMTLMQQVDKINSRIFS